MMHSTGNINLWALGYDDPSRADQVRSEILRFESLHGLHVLESIVVTRCQEGSFSLHRDATPRIAGGAFCFGIVGFLVGAVVLQPFAGAAVAAALGSLVAASAKQFGVSDGFFDEVKEFIKPGTSSLILLTRTDNPEAVLLRIRGLGGTVLKTNVNAELAQQVQETLNSPRTS